MNVQRQLSVTGLQLKLRVNHEHLLPSQRLEASSPTLELLRVSFEVELQARGSIDGFDDVFNYSPLIKLVQQPPWSEWTQPFEMLADALLMLVLECAESQPVNLKSVVVRVARPELVGINVVVESRWSANA